MVPMFAVAGVGVAALASPLRLLWCRPGQPWWLVFAVWAAVVALEGLAVWSRAGVGDG